MNPLAAICLGTDEQEEILEDEKETWLDEMLTAKLAEDSVLHPFLLTSHPHLRAYTYQQEHRRILALPIVAECISFITARLLSLTQ